MPNTTKTRKITSNSKKGGNSITKPASESKGTSPESQNGTSTVPTVSVPKEQLEKLIRKNEDLKKFNVEICTDLRDTLLALQAMQAKIDPNNLMGTFSTLMAGGKLFEKETELFTQFFEKYAFLIQPEEPQTNQAHESQPD